MAAENNKLWAVVPAAGAGRRMSTNIPKQYLPLGEKTVLEHTLDTLLACRQLAGVVVVLSADDGYWPDLQDRYPGSGWKQSPVARSVAILC